MPSDGTVRPCSEGDGDTRKALLIRSLKGWKGEKRREKKWIEKTGGNRDKT